MLIGKKDPDAGSWGSFRKAVAVMHQNATVMRWEETSGMPHAGLSRGSQPVDQDPSEGRILDTLHSTYSR